jgi:hypothetical protein
LLSPTSQPVEAGFDKAIEGLMGGGGKPDLKPQKLKTLVNDGLWFVLSKSLTIFLALKVSVSPTSFLSRTD